MFRVAVIWSLLLLPSAALANDAVLLGPAAAAPPALNGASPAASQDPLAGPVSPESSGVLQPANPSTGGELQPGGGGNPGLGAETTAQSALQQPANAEQARLFIQGETEGGSEESASEESTVPSWLTTTLLLVGALTSAVAGIWLWRRSARYAKQPPRSS